jgi:diaminohydroxyphosphoribosylaminopyrimidine deaminase / 5-amino-6-(5-phosphoribosylamino)uracil reductase
MISKHNIAKILTFFKNHKKTNNLSLNISSKKIIINKNTKKGDMVLKNNKLTINTKVSTIFRECSEILTPILLNNKKILFGQIGQSLDGKIALNNGNSHYINEKDSITYLHCLRSISDAVLVGVNTIIKDNPLLTTRKITGSNPIRIIIDPSLKLTNKYKIFKDNNTNIIFTNTSSNKKLKNSVIITFPKKNFTKNIYKYLKGMSLNNILIEGGPTTLSKFIDLKLLNFMQFIISPTLIGSGIDSLKLKPITNLNKAIRAKNTISKLGKEIVVTLDFNS